MVLALSVDQVSSSEFPRPVVPARRPTLSDVARLAGVSRTAASFVVNGRTDMRISAETTERVRSAVSELNYRANAVALALRSSSTRTIAMISDSIATNEYSGQMVRGALEAARAKNRLLVIAETNGDEDLERDIVQDLLDRQVDGFLYATESTKVVNVPEAMKLVPTVLLNCIDVAEKLPSVIPDERLAGELAATELLAAGHRNGIVIVGLESASLLASVERIKGARQAIAAASGSVSGHVQCNWWPEAALEGMREYLLTGQACSAVLCMNDRVAFGVYQALDEQGIRPGIDVSVVSFDGSLLAGWMRPGLSTVWIPHRELGVAALDLVVSLADLGMMSPKRLRKAVKPEIIRVPMAMSLRQSIIPSVNPVST